MLVGVPLSRVQVEEVPRRILGEVRRAASEEVDAGVEVAYRGMSPLALNTGYDSPPTLLLVEHLNRLSIISAHRVETVVVDDQ